MALLGLELKYRASIRAIRVAASSNRQHVLCNETTGADSGLMCWGWPPLERGSTVADGLFGQVHDHVAVVSTPSQPALRHTPLNDALRVTIAMEVERDPLTEVPPPRVLEMQMHVWSAAVAGVTNAAKHLASRHAIADRDLYRAGLQMPNEQILAGGHLKADVVA